MPRPVVIDTDPGLDDALAILLALRSPEIEVVGVTTVAGNVSVKQGTRNALALLGAADAAHIPVYQGASRPLVGRLTTASFFHGTDGLGGVPLPEPGARAQGVFAAEFLVEAAKRYEHLTVVSLGPLTNLAVACALDPAWASRIERIVFGGGAVSCPGNVTPVAEANVYTDPEAAATVLGCGAPITMVGLDVTMRVGVGRAHVPTLPLPTPSDATARIAGQIMEAYVKVAEKVGSPTAALHDPLTVAVACIPDLISTRHMRVEIECAGSLTRGQTVAWITGAQEVKVDCGDHDDVVGVQPVSGNVDVAIDVDADRFLQTFLERLLSPPP